MISNLRHDRIGIIFYPTSETEKKSTIQTLESWKGKKRYRKIGSSEVEVIENGFENPLSFEPRFRTVQIESLDSWKEPLYDKKSASPEGAKKIALERGEYVVHSIGELSSENYDVPFEVEVFPPSSGGTIWTGLDDKIELSKRLRAADAFLTSLPERPNENDEKYVDSLFIHVYNACISYNEQGFKGPKMDVKRYLLVSPRSDYRGREIVESSNEVERNWKSEVSPTTLVSSDKWSSAFEQAMLNIVDAPVVRHLEEGKQRRYISTEVALPDIRSNMAVFRSWRETAK